MPVPNALQYTSLPLLIRVSTGSHSNSHQALMAAICCSRISVSNKKSCCCSSRNSDFYSSYYYSKDTARSRSRICCSMAPSTTIFYFSPSHHGSSAHSVTHVRCLHSKSNPRQISTPRNVSQRRDDSEFPSEGSVSVTGGVVALGKFDALHIGHRELAAVASKAGIPFLLSFVGMAEVLGWEIRAPIVAKCDRKRVLSSWAPYCGGVAPAEFHVQFSSVRHLTSRQFVEKLAKELGVCGVVAGENYRFGYRAAGDTSELVKLCEEYGMGAYIVSSVMDKHKSPGVRRSLDLKDKGQVSSTRVRHALAEGDMQYVSELLGRPHRLMLLLSEGNGGFICKADRMSAPKTCLLNLPPKEGLYENCKCLIGDSLVAVPCTAVVDTTHIHVESNHQIPFQECGLIGIDFGGVD